MRIWILAILAGTGGVLTQVPMEIGDPLVCLNCWIGGHHHHASEGRKPPHHLHYLASAEADFRANVRGTNGRQEFWRADIAGLHAHAPGGGPAIKLIGLWIAAADDRPRTDLSPYCVPAAYFGYWYRALPHADEDPNAPNPDRFAFCAFPDSASAGKYIFVVDENNTIYRTIANGRRGIEVFPTDEELQKEWTKLD